MLMHAASPEIGKLALPEASFCTSSPMPPRFFNAQEAVYLHDILRAPYCYFIEWDEAMPAHETLAFVEGEYPHYVLSLSTHTVSTQPVADVFSHFLASRYQLPALRTSDIKSCLQEALMNAVIHGNLCITPDTRRADLFSHYLEQVSVAMKNPALYRKRISIFAWHTERQLTLCVEDAGGGFNAQQPAPSIELPYGRGLPIIRAMSDRIWQDKPNQLTMQFDGVHGAS